MISYMVCFLIVKDANPRGAIRILPGGWSKPVPQGTPRMADAVASTTKGAKIISIVSSRAHLGHIASLIGST